MSRRPTGARQRALTQLALVATTAGALTVVAPAATAATATPPVSVPEDGVRAAVERAEEAARRAAAERALPARRAERLASRTAHSGLDRAAALRLARETFPRTVTGPVWQPLPDGATVREYLDDNWVRVDLPGQPGLVARSALPLRTGNDGRHAPVDLALRPTDTTLRSANPLVDVTYAARSTGATRLDTSGIGVSLAGSRDVAAVRSDDRLFYGGAVTDTDAVVQPQATGFEVLWQLRSAASPEELGLRFDLPAGTELRLADVGAGRSAAEVVRGDTRLALIAPPVAVGADGAPVDVSYDVRGDLLAVHVPHRLADAAYPVLVDPQVTETWSGYDWGSGDGWWSAQRLVGGPHEFSFARNFQRYGLQTGAYQWATYYDTASAGWSWTAPSDTYVAAGQFSELRGVNDGSYLVTGIYRNGVWESGPTAYGGDFDGWGAWHSAGAPTDGNMAYVGLSMAGTGQRLRGALASMSSVSLVMGDRWTPQITIDDAWPNEQWTNAQYASVRYRVQDRGLGLKAAGVTRVGHEPRLDGSGGPWLSAIVNQSCTGTRRTPCPLYHDSSGFGSDGRLPYNLDLLPEGVNDLHLRVHEVIGDGAGRETYSDADGSPQRAWQARVDRTGPSITLSGDMYTRRSEWRDDENYTLRVEATDGSTASNATRRSGVKRMRVYFDDVLRADTGDLACATDSCSAARDWTLNVDDLPTPDGTHDVRVVVDDRAGNSRTSSFRMYMDFPDRDTEAVDPNDPNAEEVAWGPQDTSAECFCTAEDLTNASLQTALLEPPLVETTADGTTDLTASDPTATAAKAKSFAWGISDQHAQNVADYRFKNLGVRHARFYMGYDTFSGPTEEAAWTRTEFAHWLHEVKNQGITPLVSFRERRGDKYKKTVPTEDEYRAGVRAFLDRYGADVKYFTAWNEPNIGGNVMASRPELAARLFKVLKSECTGCTVAAGEYLDLKNMKEYHARYKAELKRAPAVTVTHWAIHAYWTGHRRNSSRLREFLNATSSNTGVWLTEQGGVVKSNSINQPCDSTGRDCVEANKDLEYLLKLPSAFPRIKRT